MSFIIDKLRKIFPPSIHSFNLEMDRVLRAIEEERQSIVSLSQKIDDQNHLISNELKNISLQTSQIKKQTSEAVWAHIFHDTIVESTWLKDKTFSPGRWAVGYPYLYVMYRILNEVHPKRILEPVSYTHLWKAAIFPSITAPLLKAGTWSRFNLSACVSAKRILRNISM